MWRFRNPKKSIRYIPDEMEFAENKINEEWLSKRYPTEVEKIANTIKSFRNDVTFKNITNPSSLSLNFFSVNSKVQNYARCYK